ncbi:MAG: radical SAM protein [Elusimicrobiota bacterium]
MQRFADLKTGYDCNNNCVFCVQGEKRKQHAPLACAEIERKLKEGRGRGAERLLIAGGEPSIREDFLPTVRAARGLGYSEVHVQTNGRRFCYPDFCRRTIDAGVTHYHAALQGSGAPLHDYLTGAAGSFLQTAAGIRGLRRLGQRVLTDTVITKANYRDLPDLARLLVRLDVNQAQLSFIHAAGSAAAAKAWLVPRYAMIEPWVKAAVDVCSRSGKTVTTEGIPYCCLRGYESYAAELIMPEIVVFDAAGTIEDLARHRAENARVLDERCRDCAYAGACAGPWREYPELFGWSEFAAVRRGWPAAPADQQAAFVCGKNGHMLEPKRSVCHG